MDHLHLLAGHELSKRFKNGELSAESIIKAFLRRIDSLDEKVGAFLSVFHERALEAAKKLDQKRAAGETLGKLAGVPIALKDNIHVKGEISTCASKFLTNFHAPFSSTVAELIEAEDAIIIGKTNMDEFAMGSTTENSALQRTSNPWNLNCVPGGSSGGSAAAVAARFCPIAFGSDTGGSVRQPSSLCGIVGFKPTYGRVSRYGLVAYGSSLDQIGPMTHDMDDLALIMEVIGKHCEKDSTSQNIPEINFSKHLKKDLNQIKIGVPWKFIEGLEDEQTEIFQKGIKTLHSLGAKTVEIDLNLLSYSIAVYYILATAEASTNLARFDGIRYGMRSQHAKTLDEVYDLSKEEGYGPEVKRRIILGTYVLSAGYRDAYYKKAQQVRRLIRDRLDQVFSEVDLIATPVAPTPTHERGSKKDPLMLYLGDIYTIPANLAGIPAISVPNGLTRDGKPVGLQLLGAQNNDQGVISAAYAYNQATRYLETNIPEIAKT